MRNYEFIICGGVKCGSVKTASKLGSGAAFRITHTSTSTKEVNKYKNKNLENWVPSKKEILLSLSALRQVSCDTYCVCLSCSLCERHLVHEQFDTFRYGQAGIQPRLLQRCCSSCTCQDDEHVLFFTVTPQCLCIHFLFKLWFFMKCNCVQACVRRGAPSV